MTVFPTLAEAIRAGYEVFERIPNGYLVRRHTQHGYALAVVELREETPRLRATQTHLWRAAHVGDVARHLDAARVGAGDDPIGDRIGDRAGTDVPGSRLTRER